MKFSTTAIFTTLVAFAAADARVGQLSVESNAKEFDSAGVVSGASEVVSPFYVTNTKIYKGQFKLENTALQYVTLDNHALPVSAGKRTVKGLRVFATSKTREAIQKGFKVNKDGFLEGPDGTDEFYICKVGDKYPGGNMIAYYGKNPSAPATDCNGAKLKWVDSQKK